VLANNFGAAVGFLLGPALVQGDPAHLPRLLYAHAAFGVAGSAMILAHFPAEPKTPPSRAAAEMRLRAAAAAAEGDGQTPLLGTGGASVGKPPAPSLLGSLRACFANRSFVLVAVAGGVTNGVFNGWSGLLSVIMNPLGYSDTQSGWFGFAVTIACISGGIASGRLADKYFQQRFKRVLLVTLALCLFAFCWWTLSLPSALWGGDGGQPPLPPDKGSLLAAVVLAGLALGATSPLFYELVLELLYPLPEAYGAGIMSLFNNIGAVLFLAIPPSVHDTMNVVMALVVAGAFVLVSLVVEKYNRAADVDAGAAAAC
jgi:FLVCR family MFS transporter